MRTTTSEPVGTELPPYALRGPHLQVRPCRVPRKGIRIAPHRVKSSLHPEGWARGSAPRGGREEPGEHLAQDPDLLIREVVQEALSELGPVRDRGVLQAPAAGCRAERARRPGRPPPPR